MAVVAIGDIHGNSEALTDLLAQVLQQLGRSDEAAREFARAEQLQQQAGRPE